MNAKLTSSPWRRLVIFLRMFVKVGVQSRFSLQFPGTIDLCMGFYKVVLAIIQGRCLDYSAYTRAVQASQY
jgi:hypothetical protein